MPGEKAPGGPVPGRLPEPCVLLRPPALWEQRRGPGLGSLTSPNVEQALEVITQSQRARIADTEPGTVTSRMTFSEAREVFSDVVRLGGRQNPAKLTACGGNAESASATISRG